MKGTVKFFNNTKHFGFVSGEDGKDYFVHATGLKQGERLRENDEVVFDAEEGEKGPKAVNVRVGSDDSSGSSDTADVVEKKDKKDESEDESKDDEESEDDEDDDEPKKVEADDESDDDEDDEDDEDKKS